MDNIKKQLGSNIRAIRLDRELSQERLAEVCSLHRTYIGSIERGERNICLENIVIIARALNVTPSFLLSGIS